MAGPRKRHVKSNNIYVKKNDETKEGSKDEEEEEEEETHESSLQSSSPHLFGTKVRKQSKKGSGFIISLRLEFYQNLICVQEFLSNLKLVDVPFLIFALAKFIVSSKSNANHNYRTLTPSAWKCLIAVCTLSVATRLAYIAEPDHVCWDEAHFGKFGNHYLNGTFFLDVHPPLGKMSIAFTGWLTGYNGTFHFDKPGDKFGDYKYTGMRTYCALMGAFCVPLAYLTVWELTQSLYASVLSASFILFDTGCITISQYILLDPILMCFVMLSIYCMVKFHSWSDSPFSNEWWGWMLCTGVAIGCAFSVKWVGLFVILFVGVSTVQELWELLGDCSLSVWILAKHFVARACGLIMVPVAVYLAFFAVHFKYLPLTGSGDGAFSSIFQSTLIGNPLHDAKIPPDVAYGSVVTLKNYGTGGAYLHSHESVYPKEHAPEQQQITTYGHRDGNNKWRIHKLDSQQTDSDPLELIRDGDVVRLMHLGTQRNLHAHNEKAPLSTHLLQVTGYGGDGEGDVNDEWRVKVVKKPGKDGVVQAVQTVVRFIHVYTGCALSETGQLLPKWGFEQREVACNPATESAGTTWNVDSNEHKQIADVSIDFLAPSFLEKVYESHVVMLQTNNGFKPKEGEFQSLPWHWPIAYRGQVFSGNEYRVYLLGNPVVWWLLVGTFFLYMAYYFVFEIREKRKCEIEEKLKQKSKSVIRACAWLLLGWSLHYLPFYFMGRVLYYHHYFPSFLISAMLSGILLEHVTHVVSLSFSDTHAQKTVYQIGVGFLLLAAIGSFYAFRGLTYGMSGPIAGQPNATQAAYKWLDTWEL